MNGERHRCSMINCSGNSGIEPHIVLLAHTCTAGSVSSLRVLYVATDRGSQLQYKAEYHVLASWYRRVIREAVKL